MEKTKVFYLNICPIDRSGAYLEEILKYGMCRKDYLKFNKKKLFDILKKIESKKKSSYHFPFSELNYLKEDYLVLEKLKNFKDFFKKTTHHEPLKLQLYWAKRALGKESFSIIAPTGIGKTTFGNIISHFIEGKVYYLVPSKILLRETEKKLKSINSKKRILVIKKKEDKELLKNEDFDILLTTANFLHKNIDLIPKIFDLVFIDDADSLIRQPKNIDKILKLIKFTDKEIKKALEIIDLKRKAKTREDYKSIKKDSSEFNLNQEEFVNSKGQVIAASATLTPKTKRIALFRELLGFEIGSSTTYLRNIEEIYEIIESKNERDQIINSLYQRSVYWIKKLGNGGFIFLNEDFKKNQLNEYLKFLENNGISAISYEKFNTKNQKLFLENKIEVVVGFSNIRNPLTRGIDLPQKVRYALFLGVPKFKIPLKVSYSPFHLFLLGLILLEVVDNKSLIEKRISFLKKFSFLKEDKILADKNLIDKIEPIKREFEQILEDKQIIEKIKDHPKITLVSYSATGDSNSNHEKDNIYLIVSDPRGYIQASGRTSRLFPLGLTKGLALILVEEIKTLKHLEDKLKILGYEPNFKRFSESLPTYATGNKVITPKELDQILNKIDEDRKIVKRVLSGEEFIFKDPIKTALVIVESPTKAKTIANFFGKPARRYKNDIIFYEVSLGNLHLNICATGGHFVDLVHKDGYYGVKKESNKFIPIFQPLKVCKNCRRHLEESESECSVCKSKDFTSKNDLIINLQKIALQVDKVYLATDPDTEGEKIAFDLFNYIYPYNQNLKRIELHEITKKEFLEKINQPREIDINLVKAQLLRRISDRWIGFKLSEEIQNYFKNLNLSAGRVQTPVLGWILEKEKKVRETHYLINLSVSITETGENTVFFNTEDKNIIKILKDKFKNKDLKLEIKLFNLQEEIINPLPPYDTSDLLKDANNFFKFDAQLTMKLAQDLFEQGLITYHRTDSVFISEFGRNIAYEYLERKNLINLIYKRSWGEPGTHEGIRPTKPLDVQDLIESIILEQKNLTKKHLQLYGLIFNRFMASQLKPSKGIKAEIEIKLENLTKKEENFIKITENNHLMFFKNVRISSLTEGIFAVEKLKIKKVPKEYHYNQGEIIEKMKQKGLGRPSTYSTVIQTLIERKYVLSRSGYLIPTSWGKKIYEYLIKRHQDLVSENFTIKLEKDMDLIAEGKRNYQKILSKTFKRVLGNGLNL